MIKKMNLIDKNKCQDNDQYVSDGIQGKNT